MSTKPDVLLFAAPIAHFFHAAWLEKKFDVPFLPIGSTRGIGASQLSHNLRCHGFTSQIITYLFDFSLEELCKLSDSFIGENTIIGFSSVFYNTEEYKNIIVSLVKYFRKNYPNNPIVIGGNKVLKVKCDFDAYFTSYAEDTFLEYVEVHNKRRPKILYQRFHKKAPVIDYSTSVDRRFNIEKLAHRWHDSECVQPGELLPIEISRGCIFQCDFCNYRLNGKKKFDYLRDPQLIVDEMIDNYDRFGITRYQFLDDTFNDSTQKVQALHEKFKKLPFKLEFWAYLRADLIAAHREQASMLQDMGLRHAFFGIESLNYESARSVGKGIKTEKLLKFLDDLYYRDWPNVSVMLSFIIGLPYETLQTLKENFQWQKEHPRWQYSNNLLRINSDEDVTSLFNSAPEKYGYTFSQDYTEHPDFANASMKHYWVNNVGLSEEQADKAVKLLRANTSRKLPNDNVDHPRWSDEDLEILPYYNYILRNFCKEDLTGKGYLQNREIIDSQYKDFINKYKADLNAIAKKYHE